MKNTRMSRRGFLKIGGGLLLTILPPGRGEAFRGPKTRSVVYGSETPSRCPLCSMGCGVIYFRDSDGRWNVEGDPDCPVAMGSLCARGNSLIAVTDAAASVGALHRYPGESRWRKVSWDDAVHLVGRRIKDVRDREMRGRADSKGSSNRLENLGMICGGSLTNEEAYLLAKLFRSIGTVNMDTTVRASRGMAILGLLSVLGLPAPTHPPTDVAESDLVIVAGCNPGQTVPVLSRALDEVRRRSGTVVFIEPRWTESIKTGDIWLQIRPGCDAAVFGGFISWILEHGKRRTEELVKHTDASFSTLTEIMGQYQRFTGGKSRGMPKSDPELSGPYTIYQRLIRHYRRYNLRKIAGISGVDRDLFRRVCKELVRTGRQEFSASFILGAGALCRPSGSDTVRMAAMIQTLLGNLKKRGGGIVVPSGAGNAQGVCDMGLLASYLPGYLPLPLEGTDSRKTGFGGEDPGAMEALARAWFDSKKPSEAVGFLPVVKKDEGISISTILRDVANEKIKVLIVIGSDVVNSFPGGKTVRGALEKLDLLVVVDTAPNETSLFWKETARGSSALKTEVIFIPMEPPALRSGSMTDAGRRVRRIVPAHGLPETVPSLLNTITRLGVIIKKMARSEGGPGISPITSLRWPIWADPEAVAREINGVVDGGVEEVTPLGPGRDWPRGSSCGNRLYRGQVTDEAWLAGRRDFSDPYGLGLFERWGWFWPWGMPDPFSWVFGHERDRSVLLRWSGSPKVIPDLSIRFWRITAVGPPFPDHYEPFHSPLPDYLTGGRSDPSIEKMDDSSGPWDYLSRRPEDVLGRFPVIMTTHRTGNTMGSGGILGQVGWLKELGTDRMLEMGPDMAAELKVVSGDAVDIKTPFVTEPVRALALVTSRLGNFGYNGKRYHVTSVTGLKPGRPGTNELFSPVFNGREGGLQLKAFMVKVEKAKTGGHNGKLE
ncbi:MAG: molybdopterin-dependent oxidoreductase [Deltaproteobacteria bacterium]|nr:molybdopterin-dependent oxidoreductase [Deltaproteobacteria bacterium]